MATRFKRNHPLQAAVDRIFRDRGTTLDVWLRVHVDEGRSLREIATALELATSVTVSHETVRTWVRNPLSPGDADSSSRENHRSRDSVLVGADA